MAGSGAGRRAECISSLQTLLQFPEMFYGKLGEAKASREMLMIAADQVKLTLCLSRIASELAPLISINTQYY